VEKPNWSNILNDVFPGRVPKPRISGLTMVIDTGVPLTMMRDILQLSSSHIDFWKFGFGSAAVCPVDVMVAKVALCQEYGVLAYPGGTSMEIAVAQSIWKEYLDALWDGGIRAVEVSDGTIHLPLRQRRELIRTARKMGFTVLSEVGKKQAGVHLPVPTMAQHVQNDVNSGAHYVIVEGREGGKEVGVYDEKGRVRENDVQQLVDILGPLATRLIWEAPLSSQQVYYVSQFGHKVNLGNIPPLDVIKLESLRRGLRSDTLQIGLGIEEDLTASAADEAKDSAGGERNVIGLNWNRPTLWNGAPGPNAHGLPPRTRKDRTNPM
jgi:phosphosulfolactate synthase